MYQRHSERKEVEGVIVYGGFDPGYSVGAIAAVGREGSRLILLHHEEIKTSSKQEKPQRVEHIWQALGRVIRSWKIRHLGIEEQQGMAAAGRRGMQQAALAKQHGKILRGHPGFNAKTDNVIGCVWLAMGAAMAYGATFEELHPKTIKVGVCGKGGHNAGKPEVIRAVRTLFPELADVKLSEHKADAIATAIVAGRSMIWQETTA